MRPRKAVQITFPDKNPTKQSFKDECDINNILAKHQATGIIDHLATHGEHYGDATSDNYLDAMTIVANANSMFEELPSKARAKFKNDPALFLEYVQDPANADSLHDLGLTNGRPSKTEKTPPAATGEQARAKTEEKEKTTKNVEKTA